MDLCEGVRIAVRRPTLRVTVEPPATQRIALVPCRGPAGPPGQSGASGAGHIHHQAAPAATWTIDHGLSVKPDAVLFVEPDLSERVYTDVTYPDLNTVVVEWPVPVSGWAYLR